jgi:hypothetical protein
MILPDHEVVDIARPDAEVEACWAERLEQACRHLSGFRRAKVRVIIMADARRGGEAGDRAVRALAERLANEHGLSVSVVDHGDRLTVRLTRGARTAAG